ncbi:hypothetical protein CRE_13793 [Caenorhabditis remanei]|uniref:Uncharacterized protein n=1 Tax=Caenorhabditis remanei TaxID=31234 RepID=E3NL79_CAERE|nr:hypothetical protein CRE_13793 [Caenorhabditis remanei]
MLSRLDAKSQDAIIDDLDFTTMPATQTAVLSSRNKIIPLHNAFLKNGPWEFILTGNSRSYLNLKKTWMVFTFKITDAAGKPVTDTKLYAPVNNIAHSIVKNFSVHINSQLVYHNSVNYAYKSYFENLLMYSNEQKRSTLSISGYSPDSVIDNKDDSGFKTRSAWVKDGKKMQVAANISIDLTNQPRVLLNNCNMKLTAYPNSDEFLIDNYEDSGVKYKFEIEEVYCIVNEMDLADGLVNEMETALMEHKLFQYPLISPQVRSFFIESSRLDSPATTLYTSKMPRRIFMGLVSGEAYNGHYNKSPFNFQPFDLRDVHIDYCGVTLPGRPMNLDFGNGKCVEPYLMLQEALGHTRNNTSCNSISFDQFKSKGFTIFGFELSPVPQDTNLFDLVRPTNLSIRLNFNKPTPSGGIYCIVYAEFDQIIGLDYQRNPIIDTVV